MLSPPELLLLGCFRLPFNTRWLSRCLAAAPLASCLLLPLLVRPLNLGGARMEKASALSPSSVAGFCSCCARFAELFVAAAAGEAVAVLLSSSLMLRSVAGAGRCNVVVFFSFFSSGD